MKSNYSIWQQNMTSGMEHEDSKALYLRAFDKNEPLAYIMAMNWDKKAGNSMKWLCDTYSKLFPECAHVEDEVLSFIRERYYRMDFPGN